MIIEDSDEITREGGLVTVVDILGTEWTLTLEESKVFPMGRVETIWKRDGKYWVRPE